MIRALFLVLVLISLGYGADKSPLDSSFALFTKALESGKSSNVLALFTPDAVASLDNSVVSDSPGKIAETLDRFLKNKPKIIQVSSYSRVEGNMGLRVGIFKSNIFSATTKVKQLAYRYTLVFVKDTTKNEWKIINFTIAKYPKSKLPK